MDDTFTDADLFNCCYGGKEPAPEERSHYVALEVGGIRDDTAPDEEGTHFVPCSDALAEMWTVYARIRHGEAWAITDALTRPSAEAIARHLSARWGLPMGEEA